MKKTSNKVLIVAVINIVLFTGAAIILQFHNGVELSATLIEKWYNFWTSEIFVLAGIKIVKVFKGDNDNGMDNQ
jgi:hypothetical protein